MSGIQKNMKVEDRVNAELIFPKSCSSRSQGSLDNQRETALKPVRLFSAQQAVNS